MNKILLSADTINRVLGYLAVRPYNEVYQLIAAIQAEAAPPATPASEIVGQDDAG